MSASKELLNRGSQYTLIEEDAEVEAQQAEPEPDPEEQERQRQLEEARIQREEDIEYSVHGPVYYDVYPYPCVCEDLKHDCDGNEMSAEDREFRIKFGPASRLFIRYDDTLEAFKERYREYLVRRNARFPDNPIHFDQIRWKDP